MDLVSFHKLRTAVQENAHPADEHDTLRFHKTLYRVLAASGLFTDVELGRTDDPDHIVIGLCRCAPEILPWEAGLGVEQLWGTVASDFRWESHTVGCTESLMEFEGAVTLDDSGHYITVHVVAEPALPSVSAVAPPFAKQDAEV